MLSVCAFFFLFLDSLRKKKRRRGRGGRWKVERVLWVNLVPFCRRPCRSGVLPRGTCSIGVVRRGHKRTEETLVALKKSQINNLSPNDSQVRAGRTAICGRASRWHPPLPQRWHGLQQEHDYVIASAVVRAQTQTSDGGSTGCC